jgi:elongation factor Ts
MADIDAKLVKELRGRTSAGIMDCKEALEESGGDLEKAVDFLRQKGLATALKRAGRETSEGVISSYIHAGDKLGVLVEVNCETDFVGKTEEFKAFAKDIAMHIAAMKPLGIDREDIDEEILKREEDIYRQQAQDTGKPENILDKIIKGKMEKFYKEACLMEQVFVKNSDITIKDLVHEMVSKTGENISIRRFTRYQLGGE